MQVKNTDNQIDRAAFLNKFTSDTSKKVVIAAISMGLGVPQNKNANPEKNKLARQYTITSLQFHVGDNGMMVRKTKTKPGEEADIYSTKKLTQSSEPKQIFLREIESVFTAIVSNQQGQQSRLPTINTPNTANAQQGLQNQQTNTNNPVNRQPQQPSSSQNNPSTTSQRTPSTGQPQPVTNSNTPVLTNEQANIFIDQNEELIQEYALSQTNINHSNLDPETLINIINYDTMNPSSTTKLSSLIPDNKKSRLITQLKSSDAYKKSEAQQFINTNTREINQFLIKLKNSYNSGQNSTTISNINDIIDKLGIRSTEGKPNWQLSEINNPIKFVEAYNSILAQSRKSNS